MSEFYISNRDGFVRLLETLYNKLINFEKKNLGTLATWWTHNEFSSIRKAKNLFFSNTFNNAIPKTIFVD